MIGSAEDGSMPEKAGFSLNKKDNSGNSDGFFVVSRGVWESSTSKPGLSSQAYGKVEKGHYLPHREGGQSSYPLQNFLCQGCGFSPELYLVCLPPG
jgi:hypothetical protein